LQALQQVAELVTAERHVPNRDFDHSTCREDV
jgi:hypothetical protein